MRQLAATLRDLLRMSRMLREAAALTYEKNYIEKFNSAASALEHRARELAGMREDDELALEDEVDALHAPVDIHV